MDLEMKARVYALELLTTQLSADEVGEGAPAQSSRIGCRSRQRAWTKKLG